MIRKGSREEHRVRVPGIKKQNPRCKFIGLEKDGKT